MLCLLEHKLQDPNEQPASAEAKEQLEAIAAEFNYTAVWTFAPRKGFDGLVALQPALSRAPIEPELDCGACTSERRLLHWEATHMHVVLAYAPNSGREGRLQFRLDQWEPSVIALLRRLQRSGKPVLLQGDLNVAHRRELDAWGTTDAEFGQYKASGRTREEAAAFDQLLSACELVDGFRFFHPAARSATCWAQKAKGKPEQREHWKRYDYALVSKSLVQPAAARGARLACRLLDVRHRGEVFEAGRPDHVPVESLCAGDI